MDPIQTEIMNNRFVAMVEEAATLVFRAAHTTFVKQTQDFQIALATLTGEFFAYPVLTGVTSGSCHNIAGLLAHFNLDELVAGDVLIANDPFSTAGLVTHMMDIHLVRPIFVDGKLACFAWSFVHASDIGGAVPGSISPELFECFQEGIRLRPTKLVRAGILNADLANILRDNSRIGDAVWGDLEALLAATSKLGRRVTELCQRIGVAAFQQSIVDVISYSELKARDVIARLTDGTYTFNDYLENGDAAHPINIHCRLTIDGDEASIDYSGSSPQAHSALNYSSGGRTHPFLCLALTNYIQTAEPTAPVNGGMTRPIKAFAPSGTVMNATFPAAMGNRWVTVMRTYDALMGCLNQAIPGGITACGAGQAGIISTAWVDAASGRTRVAVVEPFSGGSGGRVRSDGVDATDTMVGYLKSTPIEHVEVETPLIVRRHELVPSRFGHGRHRGGASVSIELECRIPEASISCRGLDRFHFQPWGMFGGTPGHNSSVHLNPDAANETIGRIEILKLRQGDVLRMISSSGGGFGSALERLPALVLRDVLDEMLSPAEAESIYGVVIRDRRLEEDRTAALRRSRGAVPADHSVSQGPTRTAYEAVWPADTSAAFAGAVLDVEPGVRRFALEAAVRELAGRVTPVSPAEAVASVHRAAANLGGSRPLAR